MAEELLVEHEILLTLAFEAMSTKETSALFSYEERRAAYRRDSRLVGNDGLAMGLSSN